MTTVKENVEIVNLIKNYCPKENTEKVIQILMKYQKED